jgi:WD40 repeat protein/DNA-binding SARP family transcriptional activator
MNIGVLGPLEVDGALVGLSPRDRTVLFALITRRGRGVTADGLADALWGDAPPPSAAKIVQGCIARLRKRFGAAKIETTDLGYRLRLASDAIDADRFERAIDRSRELLRLGEHDRAAAKLEGALGLWRGSPFDGHLGGWEPARLEAERLEELRREAEDLRAEALLGVGRWSEVVDDGALLIAEAPLRERRWALLATAQYQAGRQGEALQTLRRARDELTEQLGVDPGSDLVALEAAILRHDPRLDGADPLPDAAATCPYLGLLAYQEQDADRFFGREADVTVCLERLHQHGVLAVVGPSGSGKSSLVRAGIVPALRHGGRDVRVLIPGPRPLDALTGLTTRGAAPALVVDQFEETFTRCLDTDERTRFLDAVAGHAERAEVVIALRADKLGEVASHRAVAALVERGMYLLTSMTSADLRTAIEEPARQSGLLFEAGLVDLLLRDVEDEPGALPMLSHALRETWLAREGRTLTVAGYHAAGGIRGAAAQTAEQLYEESSVEQRTDLRHLLLRLVTPSPEGEPVRTRVPRGQVATSERHRQLVEKLVDARLLTSDADTVELAHEALVRAWPRLRTWLDEDVEGQRILRHLTVSAHSWDELGRPDTELYRGVRLSRALLWRDQTGPDLSPVERDFLDAGTAQRDAELAAAGRRRRTTVGVLAGVALFGVVLGSVAVVQARRAADERDRALVAEAAAEGQAELARSGELAASAVAVLGDDPELSLLLSLEAARGADPSLQAVRAVRQAVREHRVLATITAEDLALEPSSDQAWLSTALSPDGRLLAIGEAGEQSLEIWDLERDRRLWSSGDQGLALGPPRFTKNGAHVVAPAYLPPDEKPTGAPEGLYTWDARAGGDPQVRELGLDCPATEIVTGPFVDPEQPLVVVSRGHEATCSESVEDPDAITVSVVEADSGDPRELWTEPLGYFVATTSGDGRSVAISSRTARVLDVATGEEVFSLPLREPLVALDPEGSQLMVANIGSPTELYDVQSGDLVRTVHEHDQLRAEELAWFSADGAVIGSAGMSGEIRLSDARTGEPLATLRGHKGMIVDASMAAGGEVLVTAAIDGAVKVWSLAPRGEVDTIGFEAGPPSGSMTVANGRAAIAGPDPGAPRSDNTFQYRLVDLATDEVVTTISSVTGQTGALSPDGARFAGQQKVDPETFGGLRIHDATSGTPLVAAGGMCESTEGDVFPEACEEPPDTPFATWVWQLRFSPDGSRLAMANGRHSSLHVWDTTSGEALLTTPKLSDTWTPAVAFGPDGSWLAVMSGEELIVHDTDDWSVVDRQPYDEGGIRALRASADGRYLVASTQDARLAVYDTGTWQRVGAAWVAHEGAVLDLEVARDSRTIVSASNDRTMRVWELPSGRLLQTIPVGGPVYNVEFVADQHVLASTPGPLTIFTLDVEELLGIARDRLTRGFAPEECAAYDIDPCPSLAALRGD